MSKEGLRLLINLLALVHVYMYMDIYFLSYRLRLAESVLEIVSVPYHMGSCPLSL